MIYLAMIAAWVVLAVPFALLCGRWMRRLPK